MKETIFHLDTKRSKVVSQCLWIYIHFLAADFTFWKEAPVVAHHRWFQKEPSMVAHHRGSFGKTALWWLTMGSFGNR